MAKSNFIVRGGADFSGITREMSKTEKMFKGFEGKINSTFKGISQGLGINLGALTKIGLIAAATKKLYDFGKASVEVASDLVEVQNVVDVTFGSMSNQVNEFASNATKQFGLSELSAKKFTSTMGAMLKSSGISGQAVTDMSIEVAKLTADMASFYNLDGDEAFTKIRSGLSGETEPLKQLGINMSVANMEAYAMSQGINKAWREMSQAEQTMLRYNYLLSVTGDAQGDFARNSGSWANQIKLLKEQWQEFMSLIGKALIEILLPIVKVINLALEGLIKVTKEIGKIYTMIAGKEVAVTANNNIADTAIEATEGEEDLADGIGKATKAAKKALASFDELNILQNNLAGGGSEGLAGAISSGGINTVMTTKTVDEGLKVRIDDEEPRKFFIWFGDKWNNVKQMMAVPVMVPAPVFASIPNPVYQPEWNLTPPVIPQPILSPIEYTKYNESIEAIKLKTAQLKNSVVSEFEKMKQGATEKVAELSVRKLELWETIRKNTENVTSRINTGLSLAWATAETNFETHKKNMNVLSAGLASIVVANVNEGLSKLGMNTNNTIFTLQNNWQTWGKNLGKIAGETSKAFSANMAEMFNTTVANTVNFANAQLENIKSWGNGVLELSADTASGFASNMISGFQATWDSFKDLMKALGEKVKGTFNANRGVIVTSAIIGGVALAGVGLALAAPAVIPYAGAALGGLASIPMLAKGGITNGPTLAMVGDNVGGKEVVSPLDGLLDMITEAVSTTNNGNGDLYLTIQLGEDTITEKIVSNINRQSRISGKTVIEV